eukprot:scaffold1047_cov112-Isochrysis_galbana.AAC.3
MQPIGIACCPHVPCACAGMVRVRDVETQIPDRLQWRGLGVVFLSLGLVPLGRSSSTQGATAPHQERPRIQGQHVVSPHARGAPAEALFVPTATSITADSSPL